MQATTVSARDFQCSYEFELRKNHCGRNLTGHGEDTEDGPCHIEGVFDAQLGQLIWEERYERNSKLVTMVSASVEPSSWAGGPAAGGGDRRVIWGEFVPNTKVKPGPLTLWEQGGQGVANSTSAIEGWCGAEGGVALGERESGGEERESGRREGRKTGREERQSGREGERVSEEAGAKVLDVAAAPSLRADSPTTCNEESSAPGGRGPSKKRRGKRKVHPHPDEGGGAYKKNDGTSSAEARGQNTRREEDQQTAASSPPQRPSHLGATQPWRPPPPLPAHLQ